MLELDFEPFNASFPRPTLNKSIGNGVEFLNRHLSAKLFHGKESLKPLLEFLRLHNYNGKVFFIYLLLHIRYLLIALCFDFTELRFWYCRLWWWMTEFKIWIHFNMFWELQKIIFAQLLPKHPTRNLNTNSRIVVWREGGETRPSVSSKWSSFC